MSLRFCLKVSDIRFVTPRLREGTRGAATDTVHTKTVPEHIREPIRVSARSRKRHNLSRGAITGTADPYLAESAGPRHPPGKTAPPAAPPPR